MLESAERPVEDSARLPSPDSRLCIPNELRLRASDAALAYARTARRPAAWNTTPLSHPPFALAHPAECFRTAAPHAPGARGASKLSEPARSLHGAPSRSRQTRRA